LDDTFWTTAAQHLCWDSDFEMGQSFLSLEGLGNLGLQQQ